MDLADLKTFEAVARHGSMNKAAAELHTVQSNVTARIRAMEDDLGLPLFQRHARGVVITPAGQRVLPYAGRIAKLLAEARAAACDDGRPRGTLTLGGLETTTALRLSPALTAYARAYPAVRLVMSTGTTAQLVQDVIDYRYDGAFVAGPVNHPDLEATTIFVEELVLVASPALKSLKDLPGLPDLRTVVFQAGCSYRQRLEAFLGERGIVATQPLEFGSLDTIVSCVSAGVGVTLLPRVVVAQAAAAGRVSLHNLPASQARVETQFLRRQDAYVSSALTAFLETVRAFHKKPAARRPQRAIAPPRASCRT